MRILLDAHLSPVLAEQLRRRGVDAIGLQTWMGGNYLNQPDHVVLAAAYRDSRILVTRDVHTIPSLLQEWAILARHHAGVILVNQATFPHSDVGRMLGSLLALIAESGEESWEDRVIFLRK